METTLLSVINQQNPWLNNPHTPIIDKKTYIERIQFDFLIQPEWDQVWTILVGPRQAGKTTLGRHLCHHFIETARFTTLLYLNCDYWEIRQWLQSPLFLVEAEHAFGLHHYVLFIDEVQRLASPGLLLKTIADLKLPIKLIASGSSQLEIKSKVQEHLTGRQIEALVLPLSCREIPFQQQYKQLLQFGSYPQVYQSVQKQLFLQELFHNYIQKDIIEFLRIGK